MEKYGTVPPRFTKGWWDWFFEYYKLHVLAAAFVLCITGITIYQVATKVNYDITVTYIGSSTPNEQQQNEISEKLAEVIPDVNGNGKKQVFFQILTSPNSEAKNTDAQYTMAIETKKMVELQVGEAFMFITDKEQIDTWYAQGMEDIFSDADEWLDEENKSLERCEGKGEKCFVKIPADNIMTDAGFAAGEELYVAVRDMREKEDTEEKKATQKASFDAANYILKTR